MAQNLYSNCGTLTTGCFLYTNQALTTPVSNGKYSDGTNCYDVTGGSGEITSFASCPPPENVILNVCGDQFAAGGQLTVRVRAMDGYNFGANPVTVISAISMDVVATDQNLVSYSGYFVINAGESCDLNLIYAPTGFEVEVYSVTNISPASAGNQTYLGGSSYFDTGSPACWTCT